MDGGLWHSGKSVHFSGIILLSCKSLLLWCVVDSPLGRRGPGRAWEQGYGVWFPFCQRGCNSAVTGSNSWLNCCIPKVLNELPGEEQDTYNCQTNSFYPCASQCEVLVLRWPSWSLMQAHIRIVATEYGSVLPLSARWITHASSHKSCSYWVWQRPSSQCEVLVPRLAWYPPKDTLWLLYKATVN